MEMKPIRLKFFNKFHCEHYATKGKNKYLDLIAMGWASI